MAKFFRLEPEVTVQLGDQTELDATVHPPKVSRLHLEFVGWLGGDVVETFPCHAITAPFAEALLKAGVTGVSFEAVLIGVEPQFAELDPQTAAALPRDWRWLRPTGSPWRDDVWLDDHANLFVSDSFMAVAEGFAMESCEVTAASR